MSTVALERSTELAQPFDEPAGHVSTAGGEAPRPDLNAPGQGAEGEGQSSAPQIEIVIPVYNEASCLPELVRRLSALRAGQDRYDFSVILINDGSTDGSGALIDQYADDHSWISTVHLVRNFGHQAAVTAGIDASTAPLVAVLDADLQDPPELLPDMADSLLASGVNVVYGVRGERLGESRFKRITARVFYRVLRRASGLDIPLDTGDFRIIDRSVVESLRQLPEQHRLLRALVPWLGYRSIGFGYVREQRFAGTTKYPVHKMVMLASHAIFSFSTFPIRMIQGLAIAMIALSGALFGLAGVVEIFGFASVGTGAWIATGMLAQTGILLLALGVLGGYTFRIQDEVKGRPVYVRRDAPLGARSQPGDRRSGVGRRSTDR